MSDMVSSNESQAPAGPSRIFNPLDGARHALKALRNVVDAWPGEVYREPVVVGRLLGRSITYVVDPECIRTLLVDDAHKLVRDDAMKRALTPALGTGLLTSDGHTWRTQRRTAAPAFRPDRIRSFVPKMARAVGSTLQRWQTGQQPRVVDLQSEMMRTAFDILVETMISNEPGFDAVEFGQALEAYLGQTNWKTAFGIIGTPSWLPHPGSRVGANAARKLRTMTARVIARRRARGTASNDLLGAMLSATDPNTGGALTDGQLIDNLLTFVVAGHETTALVTAWALRLIADHPAVEQRVLDEVASLPSIVDDPSSLDRLVYTRQVVSETMRLYPPAALMVRRAAEDLDVGGVRVPSGGSIHIPVYALHRHQRLWTDPEVFDPGRFEPCRHQLRHKFAFLPFGGGPRVCIGMGMAMTECLVILATILPHWRIAAIGADRPRTHLRITLRPVGGLPALVHAREGH